MFQTVYGDVFAADADAIAHGVNTRGIMGAGIAVHFRNKYPEMHLQYADVCDRYGFALAGTYFAYTAENGEVIYNLFTQTLPGANADYALVERSALAMLLDAERTGVKSIAIPAIGCGIGGLELHNVQWLLNAIFKNSDVKLTMHLQGTDPNEEVLVAKVPTPATVFGGRK